MRDSGASHQLEMTARYLTLKTKRHPSFACTSFGVFKLSWAIRTSKVSGKPQRSKSVATLEAFSSSEVLLPKNRLRNGEWL